MADIITITANWTTGNLSSNAISRQYDNNRYRIQFVGYPEDGTENLIFYLLVWMKTEDHPRGTVLPPVRMDSDQWTISNYFTQTVQQIKFQLCIQNEAGTFEAHSPIFTGTVMDSLEHDGEDIDIDTSELFDYYREYVNNLIIEAGAVVIDPNLDTAGAAADAKAVGDAIKAGKTFVVQVPGSATVYSGSITAGDFAKALAAYTAGSGVYAVKDSEVYQLSAASSSTMTFTQMYHGTMNFIKQIQITSADTFTVTNTALSSSAADTSYSNTASGLTATNVQDAIDESAAALSNTNERLDNTDRRVDFTINGSESSTAFVQGSRVVNTYSEVVENPNRCTSANIFYVKKGDGFQISCETEGVKYAVAGKYTSGSTWDSGWKTGDYGFDAALDDIAIFVNVATSDGNTPITPNDFTATMTQTDNTSELHDAYQDINTLLKDTSALQELIYDFHNLVNYNFDESCDYESSGQTSDGAGVGIIRNKTQIVLTGGGVTYAVTIKLNDTVKRTTTSSIIRGWVPSVLFKTGYTYKIKSVWTNGAITGVEDAKVPTVSAYRAGSSSSVGTYEYSEDSKTFVRTVVGDGALYNIALYIPAYYVLTDVELTVTVEEIASYDIKDQYVAEMIDTIQKVRNEADAPALVFPWVTDIHRYVAGVQTFDDMINNIKAFAKQVKCDFVLNSGDTIQGDKSQAVSLGYAYDCIAAFKNIGVALMYVEGNHDNNPYISSGALTFTLKQVYSGFFSATKGVSFNPNENGTDYYFDFNGLDVRFISLNSCNSELATNYAYGASTATWLANALDTEKKVIVVAHVSPIKEHVWNNNSPINSASISTVLSDFVSGGGKLILLTGHSHVDAEFIEPYCEVTSVCQKFEKADISTTQYEAITGEINGIRNPDRTEGTETADAWTVAVYKPMSNELSLIRFGAGVDRYIHCDPITPGTVTTKLSGTVAWKTSDANVATVVNGVVTGVASGKCAIIAEDENGNFEYWIVDVT